MSEPFIAEIRIFPYNFAPRSWAFCDGQLLPIAQNTALFSLVGTTYGGNGQTTFGLPNLQGRAPMQPGTGPGLSNNSLGEGGGTGSVTLTTQQIPPHTHGLSGLNQPGNDASPGGNALARGAGGLLPYVPAASGSPAVMDQVSLADAGGNQPHNNLMPFVTYNFCIALQGVFPSRP